jgi:PKD repeat protein
VTVHAVSDPATGVVSDPNGIKLPGMQFYPSLVETVASAITFYGSTTQPQWNYGKTNDTLSEISWNFGDNKQLVATAGSYLDHTFVAPGAYNVTATVTDANTGGKRSWSQMITIDPPLSLSIKTPTGGAPSVAAQGGQGTLISATWTCSDGSTVKGLTSSCPNNAVRGVSAMDGAGNTASQ